jgi:hypothetical protein
LTLEEGTEERLEMSVAEEEDLREREKERAQQQARIYEKQCERANMASSTL